MLPLGQEDVDSLSDMGKGIFWWPQVVVQFPILYGCHELVS